MPIEPGDSWFSPKCIEVQPQVFAYGGRALDGLGGRNPANSNQTMNAINLNPGSETAGDKLRSQKGNNP